VATLVDAAQVVSAAFSGGATYMAYLAVKQAKRSSDAAISKSEELAERERERAEEARLPLLTVQIEDGGRGYVSLVVANDGGGVAKGVGVVMLTDSHRAAAVVGSVLRPGEARRIRTQIPSPGEFEEIPGVQIVVSARDTRERIWGWSQFGERKLLSPPDLPPNHPDYIVEGVQAVRAFWPDASYDGREAVLAGAVRRI
jgi:hypothetical protein